MIEISITTLCFIVAIFVVLVMCVIYLMTKVHSYEQLLDEFIEKLENAVEEIKNDTGSGN